jgi:thiol-disulfide isomerase/thioredoxin
MHSSRWIRILAMASMLALLAACGGGKGDSSAQSGSTQNAGGPESGAASTGAAGTSAGTASQAETAPPPPGADAPEIVLSHGAPIDLNEHLVKGQINIIDFYSQYCGPCRQISPHLRRMDQERDDLSVIKVDINRPGVTGIDWGSPVARQFKLHSVPHFRVYDAQGRLLADGRPAYQMVIDFLQGKS